MVKGTFQTTGEKLDNSINGFVVGSCMEKDKVFFLKMKFKMQFNQLPTLE